MNTPIPPEEVAELEALIAKATDEGLTDCGRYFDESFCDLTRCGHGDTGEYPHEADGKLVEFLWNRRRQILAILKATPQAAAAEGEGATMSAEERASAFLDAAIAARTCDQAASAVVTKRTALEAIIAAETAAYERGKRDAAAKAQGFPGVVRAILSLKDTPK